MKGVGFAIFNSFYSRGGTEIKSLSRNTIDISAMKWEFGLEVTAGKVSPGVTEETISP